MPLQYKCIPKKAQNQEDRPLIRPPLFLAQYAG
jgi:hypothetical protein